VRFGLKMEYIQDEQIKLFPSEDLKEFYMAYNQAVEQYHQMNKILNEKGE